MGLIELPVKIFLFTEFGSHFSVLLGKFSLQGGQVNATTRAWHDEGIGGNRQGMLINRFDIHISLRKIKIGLL